MLELITKTSIKTRTKLFSALTVLLVVIFILLNTNFQTKAQVEANKPIQFNVTEFAQEQLPKIAADVLATAIDIAVIATAVDKNLVAAGTKYGRNTGDDRNISYVFPVKTTAKVIGVDENFIMLSVPGAPSIDRFNIPVGLALRGNPLRDVTGKIKFGDFFDQTQFQDVAVAIKDRAREVILNPLDLKTLTGKTIEVYGAWATGPEKNVYNIIPTSISVKG